MAEAKVQAAEDAWNVRIRESCFSSQQRIHNGGNRAEFQLMLISFFWGGSGRLFGTYRLQPSELLINWISVSASRASGEALTISDTYCSGNEQWSLKKMVWWGRREASINGVLIPRVWRKFQLLERSPNCYHYTSTAQGWRHTKKSSQNQLIKHLKFM